MRPYTGSLDSSGDGAMEKRARRLKDRQEEVVCPRHKGRKQHGSFRELCCVAQEWQEKRGIEFGRTNVMADLKCYGY